MRRSSLSCLFVAMSYLALLEVGAAAHVFALKPFEVLTLQAEPRS